MASSRATAINFDAFTRKRPKNHWRAAMWFSIVVGIATLIAGILKLIHSPAWDIGVGLQLCFYGVVGGTTGGIVCHFLGKKAKAKQSEQILHEFLADNGWRDVNDKPTESEDDPDDKIQEDYEEELKHVASSLIVPHSVQIVLRNFAGTYKEIPFNGVRFNYSVSQGLEQGDFFKTNLCFSFEQTFPLIVLEDSHTKGKIWSNLPQRLPGTLPLQVEGTFNDRFTLYVQPKSQQEALELLTPDFMSELLANPYAADIEIEGNSLYIISNRGDLDYQSLTAMFATADIVLGHLKLLTKSWQAASTANAVIALGKKALRPRHKLLTQEYGIAASLMGVALFLLYAFAGRFSEFYYIIAVIVFGAIDLIVE